MMTNPECVLYDGDEVKFVGTLEHALVYLDGYADAVIDAALEEYLEDEARAAAFSDWLADQTDGVDYDFSVVPDEVSLEPVIDAASVDPDDQDNAAAYADVTIGNWSDWTNHAAPAFDYAD